MSFLSTAFSGASNNYNPNSAYAPGTKATIQNLQPQIDVANQNYGQVNTGLNTLTETLRNQMAGKGPNLANQQLQRATAQNTANQAALMAGQRGVSSNVGLMARQIANQGANLQQQAAGQSAENVLAEQLAATGQLGGVLGTQGSLANQNLGIQQSAVQAQNQNIIGDIQGTNTIGSNQAGQNAKMNQDLIGGLANAGAGILGLAQGGQPQPQQPAPMFNLGEGPNFGFNFLNGKPAPQQMAQGGTPIMKENYSLPFMPRDYRVGGEVKAQTPQQRATIPGNSYGNDKIPAMLSEKEVVLPREVTQSPNAPQMAASFMVQVMEGKHRVKR